MSNPTSPGAMTVAWMAGILLIIPFFTYICYKGRTVTGKVEVRLSITTGLPNTRGSGTISNDGGRDGIAPNSRTPHTASGQEPPGSITRAGASANPASAFPVPSSTTNTGASSIHGNLPQTQQPTQTGAPQLDSRNISNNGTNVNTGSSQSPGAWTTGASHGTSRRPNGVGVNYHPDAW